MSNNKIEEQAGLREQLENISCGYGRPHEDTCDLNTEEGAMDGCTCSVSRLLDEVAEFMFRRDAKQKEKWEKQESKVTGSTSDGYHTFDELYDYRMHYNAALFNEWAKQDLYDVHLSYRHSDGEPCFSKEDYFVVVAELPTGQISNHYKGKYRHLFSEVPERERANPWDGHTPQQALERLAHLSSKEQKSGYDE